jgi:hypothetical protein
MKVKSRSTSNRITSVVGEWESSYILDISDTFGKGSWLTTVQAHTH